VLSVLRMNGPLLLLLVYVATFMASICSLGVYWQRWLVPILPLVLLLAAAGLDTLASLVARRPAVRGAVLAAATALLLIAPTRELAARGRLHTQPTTEILALQWIYDNIPAGSSIVAEWYTAPIPPGRYRLDARMSLAQRPLDLYRRAGVQYLLTSSGIDSRYEAEPGRYAGELAFYRELAASAVLLKEFVPSGDHGGPIVRVYAFNAPGRPPR
jgi:hypothetical protein